MRRSDAKTISGQTDISEAMRKLFFAFVVAAAVGAALFFGAKLKTRSPAVITIGRARISKQEFEEALNASTFMPVDNQFRKEFLDKFIARKLILYEAERTGLHKDPEFLKEVQRFWEQALLNLALSRKVREFALDTRVSDQEIRSYYNKNKKVEFPDKDLPQVYDQIKWSLLNEKQRQAIEQWADLLKQRVSITIDYDALGIDIR